MFIKKMQAVSEKIIQASSVFRRWRQGGGAHGLGSWLTVEKGTPTREKKKTLERIQSVLKTGKPLRN